MSQTVEIYVGNKPVMNYVLAAMIQFSGGAEAIVIKARGRSIAKAVTVAEVLRRRLFKDRVDVKDVKIGSEQVGEGENIRTVSTIEIMLEKTQ